MKTDFEGNKQWLKTYGGTEREGVETLIHTKDRGYLLAGFSTTLENTGHSDILIVKTNEKGEVEWTEQIGGKYHDVASAVLEIDNGYLFTGITDAPKFVPYYSGGDIWLFKTDRRGELMNQYSSEPNLGRIVLGSLAFIPLTLYYLKLVNLVNKKKIGNW